MNKIHLMPFRKNKKRQQEIKNILNRHKDQLMSIESVMDLGVGFGIKNKQLTNELCIIIQVPKKMSEEELEASQRLPKTIEGIRIDIIDAPEEESLFSFLGGIHPLIKQTSDERNIRYDHVIGGIRIRNARHSNLGATLGAVAYDIDTGKSYGITSRHVLISDSILSIKKDSPVIQPNQKWRLENVIGTIIKDDRKHFDCCRFEINDKRPVHPADSVLGIKGKIRGIESEIICGTKVMKSGARTGVTYGVIVSESICKESFIIYPDEDYKLVDGELTMAGDSGAVWLLNNGSMKAIGLHAMGNKCKQYDAELAVALPMDKVAEFLNIRF